MEKILVIGACGQIGVELTLALRKKYGSENVFAFDIREENPLLSDTGPFVKQDVMDIEATRNLVKKEKITTIYLLEALLSAIGEKNPKLCWDLNMGSLRQILDLSIEEKLKVFWPSSIAVFGSTTPRDNTPQKTIIEPETMYGITKYAGELLVQYYYKRFGLDVRSVRYPGLISYKSEPGGGTTDYAVEIFYEALRNKKYTCFVRQDTVLPMMYMADAIRGTIELADADFSRLKNHSNFNFAAISFSCAELSDEIKKHIAEFQIEYSPDFRQAIADSWPRSIDDSQAREQWGWKPKFDLAKMTKDMIENLRKKL